ncbi:MAG: DUF4127 family protein [Selenomonadaceae bacterium]|nr:DUF4127 family protein [Selenomonadaceae bacterium]
MIKTILGTILAVALLITTETAAMAAERIIFIPLDDRPITHRQTWEAGAKVGYDMVAPPDELLGSRNRTGDSDALWQWLEKEASAAKAAVISTDAMLYGSLVNSRNHQLAESEILARVEKFRELHAKYPRLPIYAFGTILRTLSSPTHSGGMEPEEYQKYAMPIYNYSVWRDKADMGLATGGERRKLQKAAKTIPEAAISAWESRHIMNQHANERLIDLTREGVFTFFLLGGDDGARYSQTHYEMRKLREYGASLDSSRFQVLSGADELAMLMLCRAISDSRGEIPFVHVAYNVGVGADTIPKYTSETIGSDLAASLRAVGAMPVPEAGHADMILAVSTDYQGRTIDANSPQNNLKPRKGTKPFLTMVQEYLKQDYPVAVADIVCGNGADNALMDLMAKEKLLFSLQGYGGWNTATNTTGFLLGDALLGRHMSKQDRRERMLTRYLDDWGYQANVRQTLGGYLYSLPGKGDSAKLEEKKEAAGAEGTKLIIDFARRNITLPSDFPLDFDKIRLTNPWDRLFECDILLP